MQDLRVYWLQQGEAEVPDADEWLSPSEQLRLRTFRFAKRRADWRLGRWTAKCAVSAFLNLPRRARTLSAIEIHAADSGAPEVWFSQRWEGSPPQRAPSISLSHRAGVAVCAIGEAGSHLGCDVELVEPRSKEFLADFFTADEQQLVYRLPSAARQEMVAVLWSAKESALKAMRTGLRAATRSVAVMPSPVGFEAWKELRVRTAPGPEFQGWWRVAGDRVLTLVASPASGPPRELSPADSSAVLARSAAAGR